MSSSSKEIKIAPGAVVCVESKLKGVINIGSMTVIHPKASIIAEAGPVTIGENNIIEEQAAIIHSCEDETMKSNPVPLNIGVNNVFEVGCEVRAKSIGDHNVFESKCYVGPDVEIGNGCIIGAGCSIRVSEKLSDQTVITGRDCVRSMALDKPPVQEDLARQSDELTVMSEIFTKEEFCSFKTGSEVQTKFEAHIPLPKDFLLLLSNNTAKTSFSVSHLPPIHLTAVLSKNYPSEEMPSFTLSCSWLGKVKLNILTQELEKLWRENQCEILFIWCSFLKDQSFESLNLGSSYDLAEKYPLNKAAVPLNQSNNGNDSVDAECTNADTQRNNAIVSNTQNNKAERKVKYTYPRRKNNNRYPKPELGDENESVTKRAKERLKKKTVGKIGLVQRETLGNLFSCLIEYNASKVAEEFKKNMQDCNVCFTSSIGEQCKLLSCGHIICLDCLRRMCEVHIRHGTMESIVCSELNCGQEIPPYLIQEMIPKEMYEQYDRLMLNRTLDTMSNMTYCPLVHCQYPVSIQEESSLAVCPSCNHAFCIFCKRPYHGIEGCRLKSSEKKELIEEYLNGNYERKSELEKRYGKKQLTELVNAAQSEMWMSENSKQCPSCFINIEKNDGCNKMICRKCNTNFCWMCLHRLSALNPYVHYQDPKSRCYNLLFQGVDQEAPPNMELLEENEDSTDEEELVL